MPTQLLEGAVPLLLCPDHIDARLTNVIANEDDK